MLVLESNGTPIDDEIVPYVKSEILILLEKDEEWIPAVSKVVAEISNSSGITTTSLDTTATINSNDQANNNLIQVTNTTENTTISDTVDCNTEYPWLNFDIQKPISRIKPDHISEFEKGIKNKLAVNNLVQNIIDDMRSIKTNIPTKAFKIIAKKIIDMYPNTFMDVDEDKIVLGDGSHSLVSKLQDRNNYLNRPHKRKKNELSPIILKKRFVSARAGCINWAPTLTEDINVNNIAEKSRNTQSSDEDFYSICEKSYAAIRHYLNSENLRTVSDIREEWPILLSKLAIFWHFNKLTNSNIHLLNNLVERRDNLLSFLKSKLKIEEEIWQENQDQNSRITFVINCIVNYFKDDISFLLRNCEGSSEEYLENLPGTPCILIFEFDENTIYKVFVDQQVIDEEGYTSLLDAMKVCVSMYFIMNLKYSSSVETTLEFLQRHYLKIHPDSGSKCKKITGTKKKVFNLIKNVTLYRQ